jgi:hypothetical protein
MGRNCLWYYCVPLLMSFELPLPTKRAVLARKPVHGLNVCGLTHSNVVINEIT